MFQDRCDWPDSAKCGDNTADNVDVIDIQIPEENQIDSEKEDMEEAEKEDMEEAEKEDMQEAEKEDMQGPDEDMQAAVELIPATVTDSGNKVC